jgi:L-asparaginase II
MARMHMASNPAIDLIEDRTGQATVEVWRGSLVESLHHVNVVVVNGTGTVLGSAGDVDGLAFARSAVKPFQALPLVEDGVLARYGFGAAELAMASSSHSGEPQHVEIARRMLSAAGLEESDLACGPHPPFHSASAAALRQAGMEPGRLHNNCSGKHAGMLALAMAHGWPSAGYHRLEHPVQQRMLAEMARWTGVPAGRIGTGVDGCGVATFALPLVSLARAFARFAAAAAGGDAGPARVLEAMATHPHLVAGTGRLCTRLMEVTGGRVVAKVGAEGVYCACDREKAVGVALKVADGAKRAAEPALLGTLAAAGLVSPEELQELHGYLEPTVKNTRGEIVGGVVARIALGSVHG